MSAKNDNNDYTGEVRFGVVMYGGVSLAIYINGVANELYEMCCATPKGARDWPAAGSTREVYRKLSWLIHNPGLRSAYLAHKKDPANRPDPFANGDPPGATEHTRFIVDVVAGTSAGGINGVFLAKALANGEAFAPLKKMWVQEGDIAALLNDKRSYEGLPVDPAARPTQSLLNSDRMYLKLLAAMDAMAPAVPGLGGGESALADEIDLYVTTTDIRGSLVPLRLFDKVVYEKRHKQVYHFQYAGSGGRIGRNDFVKTNTPFLAFAARCTSSFPFAFEPMQVADAERLAAAASNGVEVSFDGWKPFFTGLSPGELESKAWHTRAFGDGGYLDNKPFSYVVEALSWRLGAVPIDRKLLYVEPAPAHPEKEPKADEAKPDAIQNAIAALTSIPQYETIREDLDAVLRRNRRIERVERIVRKVEADVDGLQEEPFARVLLNDKGEVPRWSDVDLAGLVRYYGVAFLPYRRLRTTTVTDDIADRMAARWGVDRLSDRLYAMRALVRAWREENFYDHAKDKTPARAESVSTFLEAFDVQYRLRRVSFLLRRTHLLMRLVRRPGRLTAPGESEVDTFLLDRLKRYAPKLETLDADAFQAALAALRDGFAKVIAELRAGAWPSGKALSGDKALREALDQVLRLLINEPNDITALPLENGQTVRLAIDRMPAPSASRTLQENVFGRAKQLYALAGAAGARTTLQAALEKDLDALRADYARFTSSKTDGTTRPLSARDLLGDPQLDVLKDTGADGKPRTQIVVKVADVRDFGLAEALNSNEGRVLRQLLAEYYLRFDEYDQISFPLYYDTGTGEPATVEVVRVSPEDAPSLIDEGSGKRRKLAGTYFHNFGGFLDEEWRLNDIMWGRLDGNERLLAALLPDEEDKALREALLGESQLAILRDELPADRYAALLQEFAEALAREKIPDVQVAFQKLWAKLASTDDQRAKRLGAGLRQLLADQGVIDYVRDHYEVRRTLDTEATLETAARAVTITGRILEEIEKKQRSTGTRAVWVTRGGRAFQALLAVSVPGSLRRGLWKHWLFRLYLFEAFVFAGGMIFSSSGTRNVGLTAFFITAVLHGVTLLLGDIMARGRAKKAAAKNGTPQ